MKPSEVLEKAAAIVEVRWCQEMLGCEGGPRCAVGAINEVVFSEPGGSAVYLATRGAADEAVKPFGWRFIAEYNDAPGRTKEQVAAKLREAAELARKAGR